MYFHRAVPAAALVLAAGAAWSHGDSQDRGPAARSGPVRAEEHVFGRAGDPRRVSRTFQVGMGDNMHFRAVASAREGRKTDAPAGEASSIRPGDIVVKRGETVRFVVRNHGKVMHEMVIGTMAGLREHAELMRKHPNMEHDEPYIAHVAPRKRGEIVWQFTQPGEFYYACLVPGHMEAGMIAKLTVR